VQLFRSAAQFDAAARDVEVLQARGVPFELLDRDQVDARLAGSGHAAAPAVGPALPRSANAAAA
jgi:D-amino-acid dehydrogenase